jgi:apolipoprotein D and lipocalin family protein
MLLKKAIPYCLLICIGSLLLGNEENDMQELKPVNYVDIQRFMGDWYVIAIIPNFIEKNAVNGIESYRWNEKGYVDISYTYRISEPDGKHKKLTMKGFIHDTTSNAEWRVRPFWPLKLPYLVIDLDKDYQYTVIGVPNRKLIWIMSRTKAMDDVTYSEILNRIEQMGYDTSLIQKLPQFDT